MSDGEDEVLSLTDLLRSPQPTDETGAGEAGNADDDLLNADDLLLDDADLLLDEPPNESSSEATGDVLRIGDELDQTGDADGRFSRFQLIGWWDQERLADANALVIGAGALGNELIKNLALLGFGRLLVADLDDIENSNLSRSVLYRAEDCGQPKASIAAERARDIYPQMQTAAFVGNIVYDFGLGAYRWADVILGGLDNREARVAINAASARCGKPWVDGAIERLGGVARVFDPVRGPCYECTMNETDWKMLEARRSCALLTREQMEDGKVPTTPTTSSVIAGIQAQEAVKLVHGLDSLSGQGYVFDGVYHQSYVVNYSRRDDCPTHVADEDVIETDFSAQTRAGDFLDRVLSDVGSGGVIEANHDLLRGLTCPVCDETEPRFGSLGTTSERDAVCPTCHGPRTPELYHTISADSDLLDRTLGELGIPRWDVVAGRAGMSSKLYELSGDRDDVLRGFRKESNDG